MAEFSLIERFRQNAGAQHAETVIGINDDAAVVEVPSGYQLAISVDSMVEGVHFFADVDPAQLAQKLLAVNLSDMAAMGAMPRWATLALTFPTQDDDWIAAFCNALDQAAKSNQVQLIGGDTCQGPLVLSLQIMGLVKKGQALTRGGAKPGDDVYVTGTLGDAALALAQRFGHTQLDTAQQQQVAGALYTPTAQLPAGQAIVGLASSCIDISDGVLADLQHVAQQSAVAIELQLDELPLSKAYQGYVEQGGNLDYALSGGEDYQLAFTAAPQLRDEISQISATIGCNITRIGKVVDATEYSVRAYSQGQRYTPSKSAGYQHFA